MNKALIDGATNNPGAPAGMEDSCGTLPIRVARDEGGHMVCQSAWKPTAEELAVLTDGGFVVLSVWCWQVPVALTVVDRGGAQEL